MQESPRNRAMQLPDGDLHRLQAHLGGLETRLDTLRKNAENRAQPDPMSSSKSDPDPDSDPTSNMNIQSKSGSNKTS